MKPPFFSGHFSREAILFVKVFSLSIFHRPVEVASVGVSFFGRNSVIDDLLYGAGKWEVAEK